MSGQIALVLNTAISQKPLKPGQLIGLNLIEIQWNGMKLIGIEWNLVKTTLHVQHI